jgi:TP901 family phage tail tape measure protein
MSTSTLAVSLLLTMKDQLSGPLKSVEERIKGMDKASRNLAKMGAGFAAASVALRGVSSAAGSALAGIAQVSRAFDDNLALLRSMPGISEEAVRGLGSASRAWSLVHADSTASYLDASYQMLSAGLNVQAAQAATETALRVAKAARGDAASTANLIAVAYNNMGDKTRDATQEIGRMGDVLAKTQQMFQIADMGQLGEGLKYAIPSALAARVEFTQLSAVIGQLNTAGMQGSMAGTAFSAALRQMDKASKDLGFAIARNADGGMDFVATLANIQRRVGDFSRLSPKAQAAMQKAFGDEGQRAVILLGKSLGDLNKAQRDVADSAGAAARAQALIEQGTGQQWQLFAQAMEDLKLELGGPLLAALKAIKGPMMDMVRGVSAFVKENPRVAMGVVALLGLAAVLSPLMGLAATLMLAASVVLRFHMALTAAGGAGKLALTVFGALRSMAGGLWSVLTRLAVLARGPLLSALSLVGRAVLVLGRALLLNPIGLAITAIALGAYLIYRNWGRVSGFFKGVWAEMRAAAAGGVGGIARLILDWSPLGLFYKALRPVLAWFGIDLPAKFTDFGGMLLAGLVNGITAKLGAAKAAVMGLGRSIKGWFADTLGIKSPSRVFMGFGGDIGAGAQLGILGSVAKVAQASGRLAQVARGAALGAVGTVALSVGMAATAAAGSAGPRPVAQGAGGGGMVVHFSPNITVQGGSAAEVVPQVQGAMKMSLREFEQTLNRVLDERARRGY